MAIDAISSRFAERVQGSALTVSGRVLNTADRKQHHERAEAGRSFEPECLHIGILTGVETENPALTGGRSLLVANDRGSVAFVICKCS